MIFAPAEFATLVGRSPWFWRSTLSGHAATFSSVVEVASFLPGERFTGRPLGLIVSGRVEVTYGLNARTTTALAPGDLVGVHDAVAGSSGAAAARQALGEPVVEMHRAMTSGFVLQLKKGVSLPQAMISGFAEILVIRCAWRRFVAWMIRTLGGLDGVPQDGFRRLLPRMTVSALGWSKVAAPDQLWTVLDGECSYDWPFGTPPPGVPTNVTFEKGSYGLEALWASPAIARARWSGAIGRPCWMLSVSIQSMIDVGLGPVGVQAKPPTFLTALSMSSRLAVDVGFIEVLRGRLMTELGATVDVLGWEANGEVSGPIVPFASIQEASKQLASHLYPQGVPNKLSDLYIIDPTNYLTTHTWADAAEELSKTCADTSTAVFCDSVLEWHRRFLKFGGDQGQIMRPIYVQPSRVRAPLWASLLKGRPSVPFPDETVRIRPSSAFASAPGTSTASPKDRVAVGRIGRLLAQRLVGVALGGGGALSFTAVPLLRELDRLDIPVDAVSGTSFGAYMAGFYATNGIDGLKTLERQAWVLSWVMPWTLLTSRHMGVMVDAQTGGYALEDTDIPFFSVATNAFSFAAETIRGGTVGYAVRASGSLPPFAPMVSAGKRMIDGFFSEDVPGRTLREAGCDLVIGANPMAVPAAVQTFTEFVLAGMRNADILTESNPTVRMWDWMRTTQRIYGFAGSHRSEDVDVDYVTQVGPMFAQGAWFAMGPFISAAARRTHALRLAVAESQTEWRGRQYKPEPRWLHDAAKKLLYLKGTLVMQRPGAQHILFAEPLGLHAYDQALLEEMAFAAMDANATSVTLVIGWDTSLMSIPPWLWGTPWMWLDFWIRYRTAVATARGIEQYWALLSAELKMRPYKGLKPKVPLLATRVDRIPQAAVTVELA